ncbi:MAG: O-antigen ligase family protein [Acidobacteriota bacterium]|nr:MAG: O-antigen ligase family protein [Acidobacteriota bacterium]
MARLSPCLAYMFIEFARPMSWFPAISVLRPGLLVAVWGFATVLIAQQRKRIPPVMWYVFGLCALMAWGVPWAVNNAWAFWGWQEFTVLTLGCVLPLAILPTSIAEVRLLIWAYLLAHIPTAINAIVHRGRGLGGWLEDENDLAFALIAALGVALYLLLGTRKKGQIALLVGLMAICLAAIVTSMSRGGFVGLAALGAYVFVLGPYRSRIAAVAILAILMLVVLAPPTYWQEVHSIGESVESGTGEQRLYFWSLAWRMFLDHPLIGVGTRNYGIQAPNYQDPRRAFMWGEHTWGRAAHSLYFTLIPEHGLIGIAICAGFLWTTYKSITRLRRLTHPGVLSPQRASPRLMASGLAAGIVGVLATGVFISVLYYPVLWVLSGLVAALDETSSDSFKAHGTPVVQIGSSGRSERK